MGNTIEPEVKNKMIEVCNNIFDIDCPILDIGEREGLTGYIDFINPQELNNSNIMKGKDKYNRKFIVFKSIIRPLNNDDPIQFFTTFFKRHVDDYSITYHTAGHYGELLFQTEGGATISQMNILYELLKNGNVELSYEQMRENRIQNSKSLQNIESETQNLIEIIKIGWD